MRLLTARLVDFRNIERAEFGFTQGCTALVGTNGQGKTNILEALFGLSALRPLRPVRRSALIRHGATQAKVRAHVAVERTGLVHDLEMELTRGTRTLTRDGKKVSAEDFLGKLVTVAFTPDDLAVTKGAPEERRRLLDRAVLNRRPAFLRAALRYHKAHKARGRLLAESADDGVLEAYDRVLAAEGGLILSARARYVEELGPRVVATFSSIARPAPEVAVRYRSSLAEGLDASSSEATAAALYANLVERRPRDRAMRSTSVGPHLDDLELRLDGAPLKDRASQGQHRALVLSMKLAEIGLLTEALGEPPVLLLDDISSELDEGRTEQLFQAMATLKGQVVMTTTDPRQVPRLGFHDAPARFTVQEGRVSPIDPTIA
ncbi:MAG: DNA replication/repair protein RecF [Deltaproteobacteria bacterium]|nr:DNA replication/repair protein RecF [Deltaproteobacteria bacterium]